MEKRAVVFIAIPLLIISLGSIWIITKLTGATDVQEYFRQGALPQDVLGQYRYLTGLLDQPIDSFQGYEGIEERDYKFQLAFLSYALTSISFTDPTMREEIARWLDILVQKMHQRIVWKDWVEDGYGDDPLSEMNMMYRGHLNLMACFHQLVSGEEKHEGLSTSLTSRMYKEIQGNGFRGILCQPDNYYVACNSVGMYSFIIYDLLHGTDYSSVVGEWLDWIKENVTDERTGLLGDVYHPFTGEMEEDSPGRHNGWDIIFLTGIDPQYALKLYRAFKIKLVTEVLRLAWVGGKTRYWPDPPASAFGLAASKGMGDVKLFGKLLNSIRWFGSPSWENGKLRYARSNILGDTIVLFGKVNVGFDRLRKLAGERHPIGGAKAMEKKIYLIPIGKTDEGLLSKLKGPLEERFVYPVRIGKAIEIPEGAYDRRRRQYYSPAFLDMMKENFPQDAKKVLGVTEVDLFAPPLNFVFGQADPSGRTAVISLHRLHQEFYGLKEDASIFEKRAFKEAVHELGHTFGLGHCPRPRCVMHFSNSLSDADYKTDQFCEECSEKCSERLEASLGY